MAADEVMLRSAETGVASLRFYTWREPTLSLGYFQPAAARLADERLAALTWVRRATGGAALVHHHEVTYSLALPPGKPWHGGEPWACRFHHIVASALLSAGAETRSVLCGEEQKLDPVLCFLHQTPGDLVAENAKVVGSAQRRQKGALLQHGGILLERSESTPQLPGLRELTGVRLTPEHVAKLVAERFGADTAWEVVPADWTTNELALRERTESERYANPEWNGRR